MKKIMLFFASFLLIAACTSAQQPGCPSGMARAKAKEKVNLVKGILALNEVQAQKMEKIEYSFLKKMQCAEAAKNLKRIEKLKQKRVEAIKTLLTRDQFLRFDAIEQERLKIYPLYSK